MVGYTPNDSMTASQKFIAGCVSGCVTRFVTQPMDVIKVRTQLQKKYKRTTWHLLRRILHEEGITAFWHGHNLGQIHSIVSISTQFYLYEMATKFITSHPHYREEYRPFTTFFCGTLSGCASATLVCPLEVIRVRQMILKAQYRGLIMGSKAVYKSGGIIAFYEGLSASLLQMGLQIGIAFTVFTYVQNWLLNIMTGGPCVEPECKHASGNEYHPRYIILASTIAGSASGFLSKSLTYPLDLAKRRLQISSDKEVIVQSAATGLPPVMFNMDNWQKEEVLSSAVKSGPVGSYKAAMKSHIEDEGIKKRTTATSTQNLVKCHYLLECLLRTYKTEGFKGLFIGLPISLQKSQVTSIVAFTSYEIFCYLMRVHDHL